jgi:large repetitive protein
MYLMEFYTITHSTGSFTNVVVTSNAATISAPAGTYNNLKITVNSVTSAAGVNATVTDPAKPVKPVISASGSTTICPDGSVILSSSSATGNVWSNNETTQSITVTTAGSYTVTVTNEAGCSATSDATIVTVEGLEVSVSITASATEVCPGTQVTFTATPVNGGNNPSITWYVNDVLYAYGLTFNHIPLNGDVVKCTLYSDAACVEDAERNVTSNLITMTVTPGLVVSVPISATATEVCPGTQVTFTATPVNGGNNPSITWYVNDVLYAYGLTFNHIPLNGDVVKCTLYSDAACVEDAERNVTSNLITMTVTPGLVVSVSHICNCYGSMSRNTGYFYCYAGKWR